MVKNLFDGLTVYCLNHEEPVRMDVKSGSSLFYACPKYMRKDDEHPDGHEETERACANRISFTDLEKIMEQISQEVEDAAFAGQEFDITGLRGKIRTLEYRVLKYEPGDIRLGILNRMAIR